LLYIIWSYIKININILDKEDLTSSFCSIYQTLYSYRDNRNSAFPEIKSQNSINALKKIKEIKEKISLGK